jgi:hypothetical protein
MTIISSMTIGSYYYNFNDIWYSSLNQRLDYIDSQINEDAFRELVNGNLTEYYNENNQKVCDDTRDLGLIDRQYYENNGNNGSLIAISHYGKNDEIMGREFYRNGDIIHMNYICLPFNGCYLAF